MSAAAIELGLKELDLQRLQLEDMDKERLLKKKQMHFEHERLLKDLTLKHAALRSSTNIQPSEFDAVRHIRLVSPWFSKRC